MPLHLILLFLELTSNVNNSRKSETPRHFFYDTALIFAIGSKTFRICNRFLNFSLCHKENMTRSQIKTHTHTFKITQIDKESKIAYDSMDIKFNILDEVLELLENQTVAPQLTESFLPLDCCEHPYSSSYLTSIFYCKDKFYKSL